MPIGLLLLCAAYVLSQFFRSFLAVLTQILDHDIGAKPEDLAFASGLWFLAFALMQIPVGAALDRVGPRRTAAVLLLIGGGGGALLFAMATTPMHIAIAMALIGIGCSPVLMASYYIFARMYPAAMFATLGAVMIGIGSVGNLAGSAPLAWAVDVFGWRETLAGLGAMSALLAVGIWLFVADPPPVEGGQGGSVLDVLRIPALWLIFPLIFVSYAAAAGLRGLWIGPYLGDVYGMDSQGIGRATLIMGLAMIVGTFAYGPLDRILGTRKWVVFGGNSIAMLACFTLALLPQAGVYPSVALFCVVGLFGLSFPLIMAHGRSFVPSHLVGRGVTLMNLFSIGGVGVFQVITGRIHQAATAQAATPDAIYSSLFTFFGFAMLAGLLVYLFCRDRLD